MIHDLFEGFTELRMASRIVLAAALVLLVDLCLTWEQHCYHYGGELPTDCVPEEPGRAGIIGVILLATTAVVVLLEAAPLFRGETAERFAQEARAILGAELVERAPRALARLRIGLLVAGLVALKALLVLRDHGDAAAGEGPAHEALTSQAWLGLACAGLIACAATVRSMGEARDRPTRALAAAEPPDNHSRPEGGFS